MPQDTFCVDGLPRHVRGLAFGQNPGGAEVQPGEDELGSLSRAGHRRGRLPFRQLQTVERILPDPRGAGPDLPSADPPSTGASDQFKRGAAGRACGALPSKLAFSASYAPLRVNLPAHLPPLAPNPPNRYKPRMFCGMRLACRTARAVAPAPHACWPSASSFDLAAPERLAGSLNAGIAQGIP